MTTCNEKLKADGNQPTARTSGIHYGVADEVAADSGPLLGGIQENIGVCMSNNENDPTDFGAFLERQIEKYPELSVSVAEAERGLEAEARMAAIFESLPRTADGVPFFIGDVLYSPNPDREYFGPEEIEGK